MKTGTLRESLTELKQDVGVGNLHYPIYQSRLREDQVLSRLVAVGKLITRMSRLRAKWRRILEQNTHGQMHDKARVKISTLDKVLESLYHGPAPSGLLAKNELSSFWRVSDQYDPASIEEVEAIVDRGGSHRKNKGVPSRPHA